MDCCSGHWNLPLCLRLTRCGVPSLPPMLGRSAVMLALMLPCLVPAAHSQSPLSISELKKQAEEMQASGDNNRALTLYADALSKAPEWEEGWWKYGGLLYEDRQFPDAARAFGRLTRLAPENPLGFALLGLCEYEEKDWENASLHLQRALAFHNRLTGPILQASAYHLGLVYMRTNNAATALLILKRLFYAAPDYAGLPAALGAAELKLQEIPEADSPLSGAVNLASKAAVATFEDRKKDAEQAYQQLLSQFPNQPFAHLDYGMLLESEHRDQNALAEFLAETKVNPQNSTAWLWLARVTLDDGNAASAREYALRARALDQSDALSYLVEGRTFMAQREWDNALAPLREAEKRAPQSSEVHYALVTVCGALNRKDEAKEERQLFLQTSKAEQEP